MQIFKSIMKHLVIGVFLFSCLLSITANAQEKITNVLFPIQSNGDTDRIGLTTTVQQFIRSNKFQNYQKILSKVEDEELKIATYMFKLFENELTKKEVKSIIEKKMGKDVTMEEVEAHIEKVKKLFPKDTQFYIKCRYIIDGYAQYHYLPEQAIQSKMKNNTESHQKKLIKRKSLYSTFVPRKRKSKEVIKEEKSSWVKLAKRLTGYHEDEILMTESEKHVSPSNFKHHYRLPPGEDPEKPHLIFHYDGSFHNEVVDSSFRSESPVPSALKNIITANRNENWQQWFSQWTKWDRKEIKDRIGNYQSKTGADKKEGRKHVMDHRFKEQVKLLFTINFGKYAAAFIENRSITFWVLFRRNKEGDFKRTSRINIDEGGEENTFPFWLQQLLQEERFKNHLKEKATSREE